jgi:hypothetical protein
LIAIEPDLSTDPSLGPVVGGLGHRHRLAGPARPRVGAEMATILTHHGRGVLSCRDGRRSRPGSPAPRHRHAPGAHLASTTRAGYDHRGPAAALPEGGETVPPAGTSAVTRSTGSRPLTTEITLGRRHGRWPRHSSACPAWRALAIKHEDHRMVTAGAIIGSWSQTVDAAATAAKTLLLRTLTGSLADS